MSRSPRFSIVTPVHDPPAHVLSDMIDSVRAQTFADWELLLVDDGSHPALARLLDDLAADEPRIRVRHRPANGGIVAASNDALSMAMGEFLVLVDHDDTIDPRALELVDRAALDQPELDYCYSDEDLLVDDGGYTHPFYKPDWSPERLRSQNYCSHLSVFRTSLVVDLGGFREGFDGSQDHDLVLRVTERARQIVHIPEVLYHWRVSSTSVAGDRAAKPYAYEAGRRAVQEHCDRVGIRADVTMGTSPGTYVVTRHVSGDPLVSVIIPTKGSAGRVWGVERTFVVDAVRSVSEHTSRAVEFVVVVDHDTPASVPDAVRRAAGGRPVRLVPFDRRFNFSDKINLGSIHAAGDLLLLLNDDVEVITDEFLEPMIALAQEPDVGAVGCKMFFADGRLQHGGHVYNHNPRHAMFGWRGDARGVGDLLYVTRECVGITAACLLTRAEVFAEVGGLSPLFPSSFNDVDFSLKLDRRGYRRIWTPHTEMFHFESATRSLAHSDRATMDEDATLRRRWGRELHADRYYNPNLAPDRDDWVERGLR
jgi:O-antigen biosynthesis protein